MLLAQLAGKIAMKNFWIELIRSSPPLKCETLTHRDDRPAWYGVYSEPMIIPDHARGLPSSVALPAPAHTIASDSAPIASGRACRPLRQAPTCSGRHMEQDAFPARPPARRTPRPS